MSYILMHEKLQLFRIPVYRTIIMSTCELSMTLRTRQGVIYILKVINKTVQILKTSHTFTSFHLLCIMKYFLSDYSVKWREIFPQFYVKNVTKF